MSPRHMTLKKVFRRVGLETAQADGSLIEFDAAGVTASADFCLASGDHVRVTGPILSPSASVQIRGRLKQSLLDVVFCTAGWIIKDPPALRCQTTSSAKKLTYKSESPTLSY